MRIALLQLNPIVGDLAGNVARILESIDKLRDQSFDLAVTSELAISGYPPKDLLLREGFVGACDAAVESLAEQLPAKTALLVGHPTHRNVPNGCVANAASLLVDGVVSQTRHKVLLPNYDVFDERRYFRPSADVRPIEFGGRRLGVHICEDAWYGDPSTSYHNEPQPQADPIQRLMDQGAEVLINLSASPFEINKRHRRTEILTRHTARHRVPLVFVNQVGGNDDLVFDGHSMVLDSDSSITHSLPGFQVESRVVEVSPGTWSSTSGLSQVTQREREEDLFDALTLGLRDYMRKCGFRECVLGLSGGIDSALAACLAAEAIGPENVHALLMPSRYSSDHSIADAETLARNLGIDAIQVPIDAVHRAFETLGTITDDLTGSEASLADQNLQARIRGTLVMIRSNRHGWLALATGNKSELAVGYCTLYGDMAGGFAVLCDVLKRDVYAVSRYVNQRAGNEVIPEHILNKPPSAELAPDQFDSDSLPPYDLLDAILEGLIEREASIATLQREFDPQAVEWVAAKLDRNEFKRRQMPPGIKLSSRAFGSGRRMPMAARFDFGTQ